MSTQLLRMGLRGEKALVPVSGDSAWGPRGSSWRSGHNLRGSARQPSPVPLRATQNFAHTAAAACPLFSARGAPPSAAGNPSSAAAARLRAPHFSPAASNFHAEDSLMVAGARHLLRSGHCGVALQTTNPARSRQRPPDGRLWLPLPRRAHPEPPTPLRAGATATPSPTFQPPKTTLSAQPSRLILWLQKRASGLCFCSLGLEGPCGASALRGCRVDGYPGERMLTPSSSAGSGSGGGGGGSGSSSSSSNSSSSSIVMHESPTRRAPASRLRAARATLHPGAPSRDHRPLPLHCPGLFGQLCGEGAAGGPGFPPGLRAARAR